MIAATRRLVITADDFGLDPAVNEAVERGHREGVLTAASLMVTGPAAADAVARARRLPGLRVGLHLDLVDGAPASPADSLPHLVKGGGFRGGMVAAGARMFFLAAARRELAAEIAAQVSAFAATGLACDHLNAHKHFHLHPTIARLYLAHAASLGVRAMRVPFEPAAPLKAIESGGQIAVTPFFDALSRRLCDRVHRAGLAAPDQVFGLRWTGAMTAS
ncbi:MAG TPA: hopanoid biosynthesis-associated protein HpnK, partial [Caulobacteraceae bacterium]